MIAAGYMLVGDDWPTWAIALGAAAGVAAWAALLSFHRRSARRQTTGPGHHALAPLRMAMGAAGLWLALQVLARVLLLATHWPLWPMAVLAALVVEAMVWLYALERRIVSRRMGVTLTGLRALLLALVILMLVQPVVAWVIESSRKRTVVVLVDASASMQIADKQMPPHEKLRLAEALGTAAARRPYRLDGSAEALRGLRERLAGELGRLDRLAKTDAALIGQQLPKVRKRLQEDLPGWGEAVAEQVKLIDAVLAEFPNLPQGLRATLMDTKGTLSKEVGDRLTAAAGWADPKQAAQFAANLKRLRDAVARAVAGLGKAETTARRASEALDALMYQMLGPADRAAVDAVAAMSRSHIAAAVLTRPAAGGDPEQPPAPSILQALSQRYNVKVYTFAAAPAEVDARAWAPAAGSGTAGATTSPAMAAVAAVTTRPADELMRTDLAAALKKVLSESDLAGVIALTDGQHNAAEDPEPLARQLGARGAAFSAVVIGCEKPPTDAGIISVESPDTVSKGDKMFANAELKLDGLNGKRVMVKLYDGKRIVDTKQLTPRSDSLRTRVQLADEPKKAGLHDYRVEVEVGSPGEIDEAFTENNRIDLAVAVTEAKTKLLLIDSRPRWEYRYLKNLFTGRDQTVQIQYLLTKPDRFFGQPAIKSLPASVSRPAGQEEATALPTTEEEWMKFDLIILGDVPPGELAAAMGPEARKAPDKDPAAEAMRILRKFVTDRGGTLILIAGRQAMPAGYVGTSLAELVPLQLRTDRKRTCPRQGVRIALTDAGADHVILRQDVDAERSREIWAGFPPIYWHAAHLEAVPAANVLAYARPAKPPQWLTGGDPADVAAARRRREFERSNALLAVAPNGLGKVMILNFDRTWRLRYRAGDTHHHKLWGQVLRWATAGKLPAGTALVRLGADKTRYQPDRRPVIRAKMVREDFSPVVTDQVAVKILKAGKPVGRVAMKYVDDSPGLYTATLDPLPAGAYRLQLDSPAATELLGADAEPVTIEISVAPSAPAEQVELAANRHLPARLAQLSRGGKVVPAWEASALLDRLPAGNIDDSHPDEFRLWDSWVLLVLFCIAATVEWILRKTAGLA